MKSPIWCHTKEIADFCWSQLWGTRNLGKKSNIQSESIKSDLRRLYKSVPFSVQLFCMVFFQYFLKIFNYFWYSNGSKKNTLTLFFSQKQKFIKAKMCILTFLSKSKIKIESQKIGKIVTKKIFSFDLIFKEQLFEFHSFFLVSIFKS